MRNRIHEAFDNIKAESDLKQSTRKYVLAYKYRKEKTVRKMCAAIAGFVCLITGLGTGLLYYTPVAALSIDSDSSMELGINVFGKVISVKGYDEDSIRLAETFDVKHMNYKDALNEILSNESIVVCMENDEDVFVSVSGNDKILAGALECSQAQNKVLCVKAAVDNDKDAHDAGMTVGKYSAYLELQEIEPEITVDEASNMSMNEIKNKINKNEESFQPEQRENETETETETETVAIPEPFAKPENNVNSTEPAGNMMPENEFRPDNTDNEFGPGKLEFESESGGWGNHGPMQEQRPDLGGNVNEEDFGPREQNNHMQSEKEKFDY